ncbi:hypothetical protein TNCV_750551 [Trichonephila clavipes]|nr:hypothetical protein TNCV_750551 [Trichonephila clavipes]
MTPSELLFGNKMKSCQDIEIVELLNDEITAQFQEHRDCSPSRCQKANLQSSRGESPHVESPAQTSS